MILLDTNMVIAILKGQPRQVRLRYKDAITKGATVAVSSIVVFELQFGIARSQRREENAEQLRRFLDGQVEIIDFDFDDAASAGDVRALLVAAGTPFGPYDVLIAGQSLRHGATLVTANTGEFARVAGLKWEDWGTG